MIEHLSAENIEETLPLIRQYQEFYKTADISDHRNRQFFSQFDASNPEGSVFVYRQADKLIAFATVYFSYSSTLAAKVAVLNDLFTLNEHRGQGIGRQLIQHSWKFAESNGAQRLQWVTAPDNLQAQRLYNSMGAEKSSWIFYTYTADEAQ